MMCCFLSIPGKDRRRAFFWISAINAKLCASMPMPGGCWIASVIRGGFSVYAALASDKTRVTSVDISAPAMEAAREHFILNGIDPNPHQFLIAKIFDYLEQAQREGEQFDVVVLD